jgi:hypothetical protein
MASEMLKNNLRLRRHLMHSQPSYRCCLKVDFSGATGCCWVPWEADVGVSLSCVQLHFRYSKPECYQIQECPEMPGGILRFVPAGSYIQFQETPGQSVQLVVQVLPHTSSAQPRTFGKVWRHPLGSRG